MIAAIVLVLSFTAIPAGATLLGGMIAAFRPPPARFRSGIQHFAAGVVFAAVAGELLPELKHDALFVPTIVGFALGTGVMLAVKAILKRAGAESETPSRKTLLVTVAIDIVVDGLLIGVGFATGKERGILITIALTLEVLFLSIATSAALTEANASRRQVLGASALLAAFLVGGATIGAVLQAALRGAPLVGLIAFGAAALLYLVTEELLIEAHEQPEGPLTTAMFFAGFLALFVVEMAM